MATKRKELIKQTKRIVEMRDVNGYSFQKIADQFGLPVTTVESRYNTFKRDGKVGKKYGRSRWAKARRAGKYGDYKNKETENTNESE